RGRCSGSRRCGLGLRPGGFARLPSFVRRRKSNERWAWRFVTIGADITTRDAFVKVRLTVSQRLEPARGGLERRLIPTRRPRWRFYTQRHMRTQGANVLRDAAL